MAVASPERLRGDLVRLMHRGSDVPAFARDATRILGRAVPFDGFCVLTMDPATHLPTGEVVENGLPEDATARMTEIEIRGDDFNTFAGLGRSARPAATLNQATRGDLDRSTRHRELKRPNGFGDELRAVLADDGTTWGALTLLRGEDRDHFTPQEAALVASVAAHVAEGLRRSTLLRALSARRSGDARSAGLALLAADNTIVQADTAAEMWLDDLRREARGGPLPPVVTAVASQARDTAGRGAGDGVIARARVRAASGSWLLVRGSTLGEGAGAMTALVIEPARPTELAPLIADAHGLTGRERAVTQLVAQGLDTNAIAGRLHISPWTVQDHLKAIFEKVGVGTRGELTARVFFDHYAPRLAAGTPIGADGWFEPSP